MLNEEENRYMEKWSVLQRSLQFQRQMILALVGLVGMLSLVVLFANNDTPLVVERNDGVFDSLAVKKENFKPTKEAVSELVREFVKTRYEWDNFDPEAILKNLEPLTTGGLRAKLLYEFGSKAHQNKTGNSIEQSVARIRPDVSEKAVLSSFDRILRINSVPVVVPTQISLMLAEGPKTGLNPLGLYVNGVIEHEGQ